MPAWCRLNRIDFESIKIQETAQVDFISMFRASNDEAAEQAAAKISSAQPSADLGASAWRAVSNSR
jgi:hypothetical protein